VEEINSDTQTVHSLYKYMRKIRARGDPRIGDKDFYPFSFVYYLFCNPFFFSNGVTDGWNLWKNGRVFLKKNMEFQVV
jgi:hypothetical protein